MKTDGDEMDMKYLGLKRSMTVGKMRMMDLRPTWNVYHMEYGYGVCGNP